VSKRRLGYFQSRDSRDLRMMGHNPLQHIQGKGKAKGTLERRIFAGTISAKD